jgi:putative two-component system response regulator
MELDRLRAARILIIDDEHANIRLLEHVLRQAGYANLSSTMDGDEALGLYLRTEPDLILLDLHMSYVSGFDLLAQLRKLGDPESILPILVLTADSSSETRQRALAEGASDFLTKPLDIVEVRLRIQNLLKVRLLQQQVLSQKQLLEEKIYERTQDLEQTRLEILERLALAAEYRDDDTGQHTKRVGRGAALIAASLGLPEAQVTMLRRVAPLHDVGKIGIPDHIFLKPGRLTDEEFKLMQQHTLIGAKILGGSQWPLLQMAESIALSHHERWDGSGYPYRLAGEEIPLASRIVAVADVFDALTHERPYKQAWTREAALEEIERQRGRQFDPRVVDAFRALVGNDEVREPEELRDRPRLHGAYLPLEVAPQQADLSEPLTAREREVLSLLATGLTNPEMAKALRISSSAVKIHIERIIGKLGVSDRAQAAVRANTKFPGTRLQVPSS